MSNDDNDYRSHRMSVSIFLGVIAISLGILLWQNTPADSNFTGMAAIISLLLIAMGLSLAIVFPLIIFLLFREPKVKKPQASKPKPGGNGEGGFLLVPELFNPAEEKRWDLRVIGKFTLLFAGACLAILLTTSMNRDYRLALLILTYWSFCGGTIAILFSIKPKVKKPKKRNGNGEGGFVNLLYILLAIGWLIAGFILLVPYILLSGGNLGIAIRYSWISPLFAILLFFLFTLRHTYGWGFFLASTAYICLPIIMNGASIGARAMGLETVASYLFGLRYGSLLLVPCAFFVLCFIADLLGFLRLNNKPNGERGFARLWVLPIVCGFALLGIILCRNGYGPIFLGLCIAMMFGPPLCLLSFCKPKAKRGGQHGFILMPVFAASDKEEQTLKGKLKFILLIILVLLVAASIGCSGPRLTTSGSASDANLLALCVGGKCFVDDTPLTTAAHQPLHTEEIPVASEPATTTEADPPRGGGGGREPTEEETAYERSPSLTFSLNTGVWDKYIGGSNFLISDKTFGWASLDLSWRGFTFGIWQGFPIGGAGFNKDYRTETDLTGTYASTFNLGCKAMDWSAYVAYYQLSPISDHVSMMDIGARISMPDAIWGVAPFAKIAYQPVFGGYDNGWQFSFGAEKAFELGNGFTVDAGAFALYDTGVFSLEPGWNGKCWAGLGWSSGKFHVHAGYEAFFELGDGRSDRNKFNDRIGLSAGLDL